MTHLVLHEAQDERVQLLPPVQLQRLHPPEKRAQLRLRGGPHTFLQLDHHPVLHIVQPQVASAASAVLLPGRHRRRRPPRLQDRGGRERRDCLDQIRVGVLNVLLGALHVLERLGALGQDPVARGLVRARQRLEAALQQLFAGVSHVLIVLGHERVHRPHQLLHPR